MKKMNSRKIKETVLKLAFKDFLIKNGECFSDGEK